VLVVGGDDASDKQLATTEIFDPTKPAASAWSQGPSLAAPRRSHAAVLLKSGEVLVVGGYNGSAGYLASIAIYVPSASSWKIPAAKMSTVRHIPAAIRLTSGKVLIVGGILTTTSESDTLEVYDPSAGTFATVKDKLSYPKYRPSLSLLSDGRVLIVGGVGYGSNQSDEIYDPIANSLKKITHPGGPPEEHAAVVLKDGKVLVCGGNLGANHNKALIYDPDQGGSWMPQPEMIVGRQRHRAVTLKDGSVLVVGGRKHLVEAYVNVAEIYYP
jgi:hypothetical protein